MALEGRVSRALALIDWLWVEEEHRLEKERTTAMFLGYLGNQVLCGRVEQNRRAEFGGNTISLQ